MPKMRSPREGIRRRRSLSRLTALAVAYALLAALVARAVPRPAAGTPPPPRPPAPRAPAAPPPADAVPPAAAVPASQAPLATLTATPNPAAVGERVRFDASSSTAPGGKIVRYEWDLG